MHILLYVICQISPVSIFSLYLQLSTITICFCGLFLLFLLFLLMVCWTSGDCKSLSSTKFEKFLAIIYLNTFFLFIFLFLSIIPITHMLGQLIVSKISKKLVISLAPEDGAARPPARRRPVSPPAGRPRARRPQRGPGAAGQAAADRVDGARWRWSSKWRPWKMFGSLQELQNWKERALSKKETVVKACLQLTDTVGLVP